MTQGWGWAALLLLALLPPGDEVPPAGSILTLETPLPSGWREAARLVLTLDDVVAPRGQAFIVRVRATGRRQPDELLGSFGVLAIRAGEPGMRPPASYRIDVTRGLRRWGERHPKAKAVPLALATMGPGSQPLVVDWRVGRATLAVRSDPAAVP
jgi:hypothetical protein